MKFKINFFERKEVRLRYIGVTGFRSHTSLLFLCYAYYVCTMPTAPAQCLLCQYYAYYAYL